MPDKIITQRAQGYGSVPAAVTVQIDGATILQGDVPTVDAPPPAMPDLSIQNLGVDAWSWTIDSAFQGTQTMTVTVNSGRVLLCDTYYTLSDQADTVFPLTLLQEVDDEWIGVDPLTAVTINGVSQNPLRSDDFVGQWVWQLDAGDQLVATVNIMNTPEPSVVPHVIFDSVPATIVTGSTGVLQLQCPKGRPARPLPRTFSWQVINGTTTDADFVSTSGNVVFETANNTLEIATTNNGPVTGSKTFQIQMRSSNGTIVATSPDIALV